MEMPGSTYLGTPLAPFLMSGQVPSSRLDEMVQRILTSMFAAGLFDHAPVGSPSADVETPAHQELARDAAAQGTVLLQNQAGILPLDATRVHSIAIVGPAGDASPIYQGFGSSQVTAGGIECRDTPGGHRGARRIVDRRRLRPGGRGILHGRATTLASQSDVAVVVVGVTSSEGSDRSSTALAGTQDALVAAVAQANPRTIVAVYAPAQVDMPWAGQVQAIPFGGLPGQAEGGRPSRRCSSAT